MSLPPKDVDASDLWLRLSKRPRPMKVIPFPARGESPGELALWVLTETELHECRADAEKVARAYIADAKDTSFGYLDVYRQECAVQLVCRACRDPKGRKGANGETWHPPVFGTAKQVRGTLTTDEIAIINNAYDQFRRESGPILSELTGPELEAWLKVLQEGASRVPLAQLSGEALNDLVMFLVSRIPQTDTGSAGLPQDASLSEPRTTPVSDLIDPASVVRRDE